MPPVPPGHESAPGEGNEGGEAISLEIKKWSPKPIFPLQLV